MGAVAAWLDEPRYLLDALRDAGFRIGMGEELKLLRLLDLLAQRGGIAETAEELTHWLSPVLCTRSDQVPRLREQLNAQLRAPQRRDSIARRRSGLADNRPAEGWQLPRLQSRTLVMFVLVTLAITVFGVLFVELRAVGTEFYHTFINVPALLPVAPERDVAGLAVRSVAGLIFLGVLAALLRRRMRFALRRARVIDEGKPCGRPNRPAGGRQQ